MCFLLNEQGWITTLCVDCAEASYKLFIANADVKNQMKDERLVLFCMSCLSHHVELREVVEPVMILLHGSPRV